MVFTVVDERPVRRRGYELNECVAEGHRRLRASLHDGARRSPEPDAVLILAESEHLMAPMESIRILEELNGDHVYRGVDDRLR